MKSIQRDIDTALQISDLSLTYSSHGGSRAFQAIEAVSFDVSRGSVLALLGESGSGKSTLAKYLAARGLEGSKKSDRIKFLGGDARVLGTSLPELRPRSLKRLAAFIGFLQQDAGARLTPDLNIGDTIFQPIEERVRKFDRSSMGEAVAEMFDIVGLPLTFLQKYPFELSKGQRQRVAVIQSLITEPTVLIADEPTLGVDANNRPKIVDLINWYRNKRGATILLVSHDIGMLEALVEEILILQEGTTVGYGNINEIFRHADHPYVKRLAEALRSTAYDEIATD